MKKDKGKNTAGDFRNKKIDIGDGFMLGLKQSVDGMCYLEDKLKNPLSDIKFDKGSFHELRTLLISLAISSNPDKSQEEIEKKVGQLDVEQVNDIVAQLPPIPEPKNPMRPVRGNLVESSPTGR